jgi:hypothetical protein
MVKNDEGDYEKAGDPLPEPDRILWSGPSRDETQKPNGQQNGHQLKQLSHHASLVSGDLQVRG